MILRHLLLWFPLLWLLSFSCDKKHVRRDKSFFGHAYIFILANMLLRGNGTAIYYATAYEHGCTVEPCTDTTATATWLEPAALLHCSMRVVPPTTDQAV